MILSLTYYLHFLKGLFMKGRFYIKPLVLPQRDKPNCTELYIFTWFIYECNIKYNIKYSIKISGLFFIFLFCFFCLSTKTLTQMVSNVHLSYAKCQISRHAFSSQLKCLLGFDVAWKWTCSFSDSKWVATSWKTSDRSINHEKMKGIEQPIQQELAWNANQPGCLDELSPCSMTIILIYQSYSKTVCKCFRD